MSWCRFEGCERSHSALGLCRAHYLQQRRGAELTVIRSRSQVCAECGEPSMAFYCSTHSKMDARLKFTYGITLEQRNKMLADQGGMCAICLVNPATNVDHNHVTGEVRGMLCGDHNRAIGLLNDNPTFLRSAAAYLERKSQDV